MNTQVSMELNGSVSRGTHSSVRAGLLLFESVEGR